MFKQRLSQSFVNDCLQAVRHVTGMIAIILAAIGVTHAAEVNLGTGCPGDASNSVAMAEYLFNESSGASAFNVGVDGPAGDASLLNGVVFDTDVPWPNLS